MFSGLAYNSLICMAVAVVPALAYGQGAAKSMSGTPVSGQVRQDSKQVQARLTGSVERTQNQNAQSLSGQLVGDESYAPTTSPLTFIEPRVELTVEKSKGRLLQFHSNLRRVAVADADVGSLVQVSPTQLLVLGRGRGVTHLTVWPVGQEEPVVILLRVLNSQ